jgi:hypothetical protein
MSKRKPATVVAVKKTRPKSIKSPPAKATAAHSIYSVHPGVSMVQKWFVEMKQKTGRSLEEWVKHIKSAGPDSEKACRDWLKAQYSLGTNTAWWLAERAFGNALGMADETPAGYLAAAPKYVAEMYAKRTLLRPLHDRLIELGQSLGDDVRICPCKTIVPLYRAHVFTEIKPASLTRIDLGFALKDEPFTQRLTDTGGLAKKNRITHRVAITKLTDIDLQVKRWLKQAYELDA